MRAVVVPEYGPPSVLELREVTDPEPGPGQVAIDVSHAGVNFAEVMARTGAVPALKPPFVPGLEVSGRVRSLGPDVDGLAVGDRVAALTVAGGYAEVALADAGLVFALDGLDGAITLAEAAAMPTIVPTALALCELARVGQGDTVCVQAAAGGVGSIVPQIARHLGATTLIGVVGSIDKREAAKSFGYDHVIERTELEGGVKDLTNGVGVDVLLDSVGGAQRAAAVELLSPLGRLVAFGNASGEQEAQIESAKLRTGNRSVIGFSITALKAASPAKVQQLIRRALQLVKDGHVRVKITHELALDEAAHAHELLGAGSTTGKLVLRVSG
jgi:NADPH2:quinone reductase